jgi:hypothetical protein
MDYAFMDLVPRWPPMPFAVGGLELCSMVNPWLMLPNSCHLDGFFVLDPSLDAPALRDQFD